ncbi:hypothetical protein V6Z11_D12G186600 [Gossypium hirsutum]
MQRVSVFHSDLLAWQEHRNPFKVLKLVNQRAYKPKLIARLNVNQVLKVDVPNPICSNQRDLDQGKSQCGQVRLVDSCKREVPKRRNNSS